MRWKCRRRFKFSTEISDHTCIADIGEAYEVPIEEKARVAKQGELLLHLRHQREDLRAHGLLHRQREESIDRLGHTLTAEST